MEYLYCESSFGRGSEGFAEWKAPKTEDQAESDEVEQEVEFESITEEPKLEAKETIKKYDKLMQLWADIIEKGPSWEPGILDMKRKAVGTLLHTLGILDKKGKCDIDKLLELSGYITSLKETPIKDKYYPKFDKFQKGYEEAKEENGVLFDDLKGRGEDIQTYLYGLGIVMDNEIVYESIFENDPIRKGKFDKVENGRHRVASMESLGKCGYFMSHPWIKTVYEK